MLAILLTRAAMSYARLNLMKTEDAEGRSALDPQDAACCVPCLMHLQRSTRGFAIRNGVRRWLMHRFPVTRACMHPCACMSPQGCFRLHPSHGIALRRGGVHDVALQSDRISSIAHALPLHYADTRRV